MPTFQNVSYNSSRVQRAYRINNIETLKLNHKIQLLEKERLHRQRITNQDIRTIALTLDYIHTCSGHSPEGLAPDGGYVSTVESTGDKGPCFLYGERIVSRKKRRTLRPQSAVDKSSSRLSSETASMVSTTEVTARPQSSPMRGTTFVTHLAREDTESVFGLHSEPSGSNPSTPSSRFKPAWTEEPMPEVTKILLRANTENAKRNTIFDRSREFHGLSGGGSAALKTLTRSLRIKSQSESENQLQNADDKPGLWNSERRSSRPAEFFKRESSAGLSADAFKPPLSQSLSGPISSTKQRQYIMDSKKALNTTRSQVIQKRVNKFVTDSSLM